MVRSRARLADELRARTAELRRTRDERARMEVAADRARLSGELDRLLQRRLGELAQLADAGSQPADAAATLARIERESRETLDEMRAAVGVLRDAPATEPLPDARGRPGARRRLAAARPPAARLRRQTSIRACSMRRATVSVHSPDSPRMRRAVAAWSYSTRRCSTVPSAWTSA